MKNKNTLLSLMCLLTLASCGGSGGGSGSSSGSTPSDGPQEMQSTEGVYKAIIRPYNNTLAGWIPNGVADIKISGDDVEIKTWMDDSANVVHMQNIHVGTKCPDMSADANKDGFVDYAETMRVTNKVLLPLDANLNSQENGAGLYPKGNFSYFQRASLSSMMSDLQAPDANPNDHVMKLRANQDLNLAGRVIIVTGVVGSRTLPPTVSTINGQTPQASIPIACGVIERVPEATP